MGGRQKNLRGGPPKVRSERTRSLGSLVAFLLPLVVYILTLAREITFVDSGELTAAAATLGIAHPPGYPLFTLIGHILSLVPVGTVAFRVGLVSACAAALTSLVIYRTGWALLRNLYPGRAGAALTLAPLAGALLFAFAKTPWSQAVVVEVYTLQALLVTVFLASCALALRHPPTAVRLWPWVAFSVALALTNHLTGILLAPGLLAFLIISLIARGRGPGRLSLPLWKTLGAGALALLLYLYLPLRSRMGPAVCWDYPETLHRFLVHVTARQYHGALGSRGIRIEELQRFLTRQLPEEASWILAVLAVIGLFALLRGSWRFGLITLVSVAAFLLYNMAYPIHDIHLYYVPVLAVLALWAAVGAGALVRLASGLHGVAAMTAAVVLSLACLLPLTMHWRANDQHGFKLVAHYVRDALRYVEPNAVLFSGHWDTFSSPAIYYQTVEGYRPDVVVLDVQSLSSAALQKRLSEKAPDLVEACREEMEAVAQIVHLSELDMPYDLSDARERFKKLKRALAVNAATLRPTYATSDLSRNPMFAGFHFIPEGLVARLEDKDVYRPFPQPKFSGPGITRARIRNRQEHYIFGEYARMLHDRARYLERHGRQLEAQLLSQMARRLSQ